MFTSLRKWFTLVELMIVIAIIGILAAALFPSLSSYLARWRDTVRIVDIKTISIAFDQIVQWPNIWTYPDWEKFTVPTWEILYPLSDDAINNNTRQCVSFLTISTFFLAPYLPGWIVPIDPVETHNNGCQADRYYAFDAVKIDSDNVLWYTLMAILENPNWWNYSGSAVGDDGDGIYPNIIGFPSSSDLKQWVSNIYLKIVE